MKVKMYENSKKNKKKNDKNTSILISEWLRTSDLPNSYIIRLSQVHIRAISYMYSGCYFDLSPIRVPDMVCKVMLICPICTFLLHIGNGPLFFNSLYMQVFFFISIRTQNGPTGAPFNLSTCGLLQVVAKIWKFYLITGLSKFNPITILTTFPHEWQKGRFFAYERGIKSYIIELMMSCITS